jgi:hypothetical protein
LLKASYKAKKKIKKNLDGLFFPLWLSIAKRECFIKCISGRAVLLLFIIMQSVQSMSACYWWPRTLPMQIRLNNDNEKQEQPTNKQKTHNNQLKWITTKKPNNNLFWPKMWGWHCFAIWMFSLVYSKQDTRQTSDDIYNEKNKYRKKKLYRKNWPFCQCAFWMGSFAFNDNLQWVGQ